MLTSASRATASPAPTATPLIAETTGFTEATIDSTTARASRHCSTTAAWSWVSRSTMARSPPAENARPAPVMTDTADRVVGVHHRPDGRELAVQLLVGRVEHLRPVDGDEHDPGLRGARSADARNPRRSRAGRLGVRTASHVLDERVAQAELDERPARLTGLGSRPSGASGTRNT